MSKNMEYKYKNVKPVDCPFSKITKIVRCYNRGKTGDKACKKCHTVVKKIQARQKEISNGAKAAKYEINYLEQAAKALGI